MGMTNYEAFIATSRYARWREDDARRENWGETVDRYIEFMQQHLTKFGMQPGDPVFERVRFAIKRRHIMPSMRALMTAGPALERSHMAGYNCSFVAVDDFRALDEILWVLSNGTGVGYSVESKYVDQLPAIPESFGRNGTTIKVADSREGWANAYRELIQQLLHANIPDWDVSSVRPAGARLKTFGGRSSGPGPLVQLFQFTIDTFKSAAGRRLKPLEVHDIVCKIGEVIVSGGVRRSALISLSDVSNYELAKAKSGSWWETHPERAMANNSATYRYKPSAELFLKEWGNLIESGSGERGIFNLDGVRRGSPKRRDVEQLAGTNPCGEIALRNMGLCNLTEVVINAEDLFADVRHKVQLAAIVGTWQATLTEFPYVREDWARNAKDEALLGVSLTGIYGHRLFNEPQDRDLPRRLNELKSFAIEMNKEWATKLGINPAAAVTTVKPSGTVSQLTGVSSGIHPWHSKYYIRTVRAANTDPLTALMKDAGVPNEPDVMKPDTTTVFSFPIAAPEGAVTRDQVSALRHLELYRIYRMHWAEHTVSITVNVKPEEWVEVGAWVYKHWDDVAGVSFLPYSEHTYQQAPYQEITKEEYEALVEASPSEVRFADLHFYENEDGTSGAKTLACSSDTGCEDVDIS